MNVNDRAKNLATLILTNSDRITRAMRQEAFQLLEDIRVAESDAEKARLANLAVIETSLGRVTISKSHLAKYTDLAKAGRYIQAIKESRADYGLGLREAKYLIDAIQGVA